MGTEVPPIAQPSPGELPDPCGANSEPWGVPAGVGAGCAASTGCPPGPVLMEGVGGAVCRSGPTRVSPEGQPHQLRPRFESCTLEGDLGYMANCGPQFPHL